MQKEATLPGKTVLLHYFEVQFRCSFLTVLRHHKFFGTCFLLSLFWWGLFILPKQSQIQFKILPQSSPLLLLSSQTNITRMTVDIPLVDEFLTFANCFFYNTLLLIQAGKCQWHLTEETSHFTRDAGFTGKSFTYGLQVGITLVTFVIPARKITHLLTHTLVWIIELNAHGKFKEHERSTRVTQGAAVSNSCFLSVLQTTGKCIITQWCTAKNMKQSSHNNYQWK